MRKAVRRIAAAAGVLVAGAALPLVITAPAHASTDQCMGFLATKGYVAGPKVHAACSKAADGSQEGWIACDFKLMQLHVRQDHAGDACSLAAR